MSPDEQLEHAKQVIERALANPWSEPVGRLWKQANQTYHDRNDDGSGYDHQRDCFNDGYEHGYKAALTMVLATHHVPRTYWQGLKPEFVALLMSETPLSELPVTDSTIEHTGCSCGHDSYPCPTRQRLAVEAGILA